MTTIESMIQRRVHGGANEAQSRELLTELLAVHSGDNLAAALVYEGFATERQARDVTAEDWACERPGVYIRPDGVSIRRHARETWLVHNQAGKIACRNGRPDGMIAFGSSLQAARVLAATIPADAAAFHSRDCAADCPGHTRVWRGHLVEAAT